MSRQFATVDVVQLRQFARGVLLTEGTAIAPDSQTPDAMDDAIGALAQRRAPTLEEERAALLDEVTDRDLARRLSDHDGSIMAAYGDAGYFLGLAMGLELAALTFCQLATVPTISTPHVRKGGRR